VKPTTQPYEYKKAPELNMEKSKLSLAEVYEKEYMKQAEVTRKLYLTYLNLFLWIFFLRANDMSLSLSEVFLCKALTN